MLLSQTWPAMGQTAFTYQGQLSDRGLPANGAYDFQFRVFDQPSNGIQQGAALDYGSVPVSNGVFTVRLDFGEIFPGGAQRWLNIGVKTNGVPTYTTLTPRQEITVSPYAITAGAVKFGGVTEAMLANGSITTPKLGANSITTDKIAPGAIKQDDIDDAGAAAYAELQHDVQPLGARAAIPLSKLERVVGTPSFPASVTFQINGATFGSLVGFTGTEAISESFTFVAQVRHTGGVPNLDSQIGATGSIRFVRNGRTNLYVGVITGITLSSADDISRLYTVRIESSFSTLRHTTDYQIFQNVSVVDIFKQLLNGYNALFETVGTPITQDMHVQYNETDFDFLSRVAENYGYFYFFDQDDGSSGPVLANSTSSYRGMIPSSVPYYGDAPTVKITEGSDFITHFKKSSRRTTGKTVASSSHFQIPSSSLLASSTGPRGIGEDFEFGQALLSGDPANVQKAFQSMATLASVWQGRNNLEALLMAGGSTVPGIRPGFTFTLSDQTPAGVGGAYVITRVTHTAHVRPVNGVSTIFYGNEFESIPATNTFRPERKTPRPHALPTNARVTGPAGEKIYTDSNYRVKVRFPWIRSGSDDENSSGWVRVTTLSSGRDHGVAFIPEIGDEVLVTFMHGDPDQPIIIGSLYNGENMPPLALPENRFKSIIRSKSGPGGNNELIFDDTDGKESVNLRSAGNLTLSGPSLVEINGPLLFNSGTLFRNILAGQVAAGSLTSGFQKTVTFTFPKAFTTTPKVLVSAQNDPAFSNVGDTFAVAVRTISTTSCTLNVVRVDSQNGWSQNLRVNWLAWE